MARVNMASIKVAVAKDEAGRMRAAAKERADQVFADAVIGMQIEFEEHPVTREIAGGVYAPNITDTLGGGKAPRNLYSFIGFDREDGDPLEPIRDALMPETPGGPKLRYVGRETVRGNARFKFEVKSPDREAIYRRTPMPWAPGFSWAQKIETHIPGFAHFLSRFMGEPSRSGGGIQAKDREGNLIQVRDAEYRAPEGGYLTGIFQRFAAQVRSYNKGGLRRRFF